MGLLDKIMGNSLMNLNGNELNSERNRLEREEKLKKASIEQLNKQKKELFNKGFNVRRREQRSLARQIQRLDRKIRLDNIQFKKISDQIRVVDNLIFIHNNKKMLESDGLMSRLAKMPKSELEESLGKINLEDQMMTDTIQNFLRNVDYEYGLYEEVLDESETNKLMDIWSSPDVAESDEVFKKWEMENGVFLGPRPPHPGKDKEENT